MTSYVSIAEYSSEIEASIAAGMLKNHDIEAVVEGSHISTLYGAGSTWAPVQLLVPQIDADRALTLLKQNSDLG